jgi:hypothetical protein
MTGGLIQIVSFGNQDIMLNGNPEITFFTTIYRRYTNFGKNFILTSFDNEVGFNRTSTQIILHNGDLLSKIILRIKLPNFSLRDFIILIEKELNFESKSNKKDDILLLISYSEYIVKFLNKLRYYSNLFFSENYPKTYITYIKDYNKIIIDNFTTDEFNYYFTIINYIYSNSGNTEVSTNFFKNNVDYYKNASMYTIEDGELIFLYSDYTYTQLSYEGFKFTVNDNLNTLEKVNIQVYNLIKNYINVNYSIKGAWVDKIAIYLFESIEIYIGSNLITRLSDNYNNIYGELAYQNKDVYNELIGNIDSLITPSIENKLNIVLYLPLPFWFSSSYGLSFPLVSLQYNDLQLKIKTKKLSQLFYLSIDGTINKNLNTRIIEKFLEEQENIFTNNLEITTLLEYIYLDAIERKKFAQTGHEYLITQQQYVSYKDVVQNTSSFEINFFHCCKDLYWFLTTNYNYFDIINKKMYDKYYLNLPLLYSNNNNNYINYLNLLYNSSIDFDLVDYFNVITNINNQFENNIFNFDNINKDLSTLFYKNKLLYNPINYSILRLNGVSLASYTSEYYNYIQPYSYYNSIPSIGVNVYSFSLNPLEVQPSGSCNFSRIPKISLEVNLLKNINDFVLNNELNLEIIGTNYNILRIIGGIAGLAYTY